MTPSFDPFLALNHNPVLGLVVGIVFGLLFLSIAVASIASLGDLK